MTLQNQLPLSHALGWAGAELLGLAKDHPDLALQLITVPRQRLHFVAFVLANDSTARLGRPGPPGGHPACT